MREEISQRNYLREFKEEMDYRQYDLIKDLIGDGYFHNLFELNDYVRSVLS